MLTVIMTTYAPTEERAKYARQVYDSLVKNLRIRGEHWWQLHIADDGTPQDLFDKYYRPLTGSYTVANRLGIGGSLNKALATLQTNKWMYITDDWVLDSPLNIQPALDMIDMEMYDYVRINPMHPNLVATIKFNQLHGWWLHLHHLVGGFSFATRPFVAHQRFFNTIGPFKEGVDAYVTERDYSDRVCQNSNVRLAGLVDMHGPWRHIGEYEVGTIVPVPAHA